MIKTHNDQQSGFTVLETVIVIAIIGLFSMVLVASGGQNVKVERFSGSLRNFADSFRKAQVASYSIKSGQCPGSGECFWRGTLFELSAPSTSYQRYRMLGSDVSQFAIHSDQRKGIESKDPASSKTINLEKNDLQVTRIGIDCDESSFNSNPNSMNCSNYTTEISVAFLAPDGRAYTADEHYTNQQLSSEELPFNGERPVTLVVTSLGADLTGYVTFDPKNANVDIQVR